MIKTFSKIWQFSKNRHSALSKGLVCSFLRSLFGITQLLAIACTLQALAGNLEVRSAILRIGVLTLICIAGNFGTSYLEQLFSMETGFYMVADRRVSAGNTLRKLPLGFFDQASAERVTATLTTTLSGVESAAVMAMITVISGLFNALAMFLFMLFYQWKVGLLAGLGMIVYLCIVSWQMRISRKNAPALQEAQSNLAQKTLTFLSGIRVIKAFSFCQGDEQLKEAVEDSCRENIRLTRVSMPTQYLTGLTVAIFESLILLLSIFLCFRTGEVTAAQTVMLLIFSFMVYASLNQAGSMLSMIGLLDTGLSEAEEIENTEQLPIHEPLQESSSEEIRFDHVSFAYGENEVLHDLSTTIKPHSLTAVIGPSGSGKTTLCHLIPRFYDVTGGSITIGGADIRNLEYKTLMEKISLVFQRVYLFEDTILNNIRFGKPDATLEEVRAAARKARCDEFIMALPDGYETVVEEGGGNFSGGEKQRISIARAMLKDAPIVILDEATSALDVENEKEILAAIEELIADKTVIMIAHRIQTVERADHIIAIDHGRIVQEGTHETLREEPGLYRDFLETRRASAGWELTH